MRDGKMTRLNVGVPAELARELAAYAELHGLRRVEALRYLVEAGLAAEAHAMLTSGAEQRQAAPPLLEDAAGGAALAAALTQAANDEDRSDPDGLRARRRDGAPHPGP